MVSCDKIRQCKNVGVLGLRKMEATNITFLSNERGSYLMAKAYRLSKCNRSTFLCHGIKENGFLGFEVYT